MLPGLWVLAYILNEIHANVAWLQVGSRFLLLVMVCFIIGVFFPP